MAQENLDGAGDLFKTFFPRCHPLTHSKLVKKILEGSMFGVVDCENIVPVHLQEKFKKFSRIFKNADVSLNDIGDHMLSFSIENHIMSKPCRMLISSMNLSQGPLITPLLRFYLGQCLELKRIFFFIQYTAENRFGSFVDKLCKLGEKVIEISIQRW